ncbi:MAG: hypothetical protein Mars2KO_02260 [Maribacter sp.]
MRIFIVLVLLVTTSLSLQAQRVDRTNFRAGINGGLVVGDFSEAYSFTLGVDLYHHWGVSREIDLGIATGFSNAFGETQEVGSIQAKFDNVQYVPLAGSVRIYPTSGFKFGADVGYALGVNSGNEGGFYYRPSLGIDMNGGTKEFHISYFAVNGDATFSSVLAGFLILF